MTIYATIAKTFTFDAAHQLFNLEPGHKCMRLHGHTYELEIVLTGPVSELTGFVIDYGVLADIVQERILKHLDHQYLNDIIPIPSTELVVASIITKLDQEPALIVPPDHSAGTPVTLLERARLRESSTTWCQIDVQQLFAGDAVQHQAWSASPARGGRNMMGYR